MDGSNVPCQPLTIASSAMGYASWSFASLIILIRIIAIWERNILVALIAIGVWLGGLALNIRHVAITASRSYLIVDSCIVRYTHRAIVNGIGILVVDVVLLLTMLIGLLQHVCRDSIGIWKLLYQQCIIWLALAFFAEIPPVVFLILDLNDPWNTMFIVPGVAMRRFSPV